MRYEPHGERRYFNRPVEYIVQVTLKTFHGIFKPTTERFEFSFCAESGEGARVASSNVKSTPWPDQEVSTQVVGAIPVKVERAEVLPLEHPGLKSLREIKSELTASEAA